jgi:hypothetical protein
VYLLHNLREMQARTSSSLPRTPSAPRRAGSRADGAVASESNQRGAQRGTDDDECLLAPVGEVVLDILAAGGTRNWALTKVGAEHAVRGS